MTFESSCTLYCSKRLGKRVPNAISRDAERSLPKLSPGSRYNKVGGARQITADWQCDITNVVLLDMFVSAAILH